MYLSSDLPKSDVLCTSIRNLDFRNGVDFMLYEMSPSPIDDEVIIKSYLDTRLANHEHNQLTQVNDADTYLYLAGKTLDFKIDGSTVWEVT